MSNSISNWGSACGRVGAFYYGGAPGRSADYFKFKMGNLAVAVFDPERLALYRLARQHTRAVHVLISRGNTRGFADLGNQLRRCTSSIPANVLEAMGEWRPGKRLNYLSIAKGSTWEAWAHTDGFVDFGIVNAPAIVSVRELQNQITALLITSIRKLEEDLRSNPDGPV